MRTHSCIPCLTATEHKQLFNSLLEAHATFDKLVIDKVVIENLLTTLATKSVNSLLKRLNAQQLLINKLQKQNVSTSKQVRAVKLKLHEVLTEIKECQRDISELNADFCPKTFDQVKNEFQSMLNSNLDTDLATQLENICRRLLEYCKHLTPFDFEAYKKRVNTHQDLYHNKCPAPNFPLLGHPIFLRNHPRCKGKNLKQAGLPIHEPPPKQNSVN